MLSMLCNHYVVDLHDIDLKNRPQLKSASRLFH